MTEDSRNNNNNNNNNTAPEALAAEALAIDKKLWSL
jgi:hypothetical protein